MKTKLKAAVIMLALAAAAQLIASLSQGHMTRNPVLVANGEPTG